MNVSKLNTTNRLIVWTVIIVLILLIPLVAMQLTEEINWDLFDFILMGSVLFVAGLTYEMVARRSEKIVYRIAFGIGLTGAFLLFWVNGAVGLIGNEGQTANLMYGAVFAVGFVGSLISRFKSRGMALTMFIVAIVQMLVPVVALIIWPPPTISWAPSVFGVFVLSGFFAIMFVVSALLFKRVSSSST